MPQMAVTPFQNASNVDIMNAVRNQATPAYQARVPAATKANIQATIENLWNYNPTRNEFQDALVNQIGAVIALQNSWTNPLAKFKKGMLGFGDTIEEIMVGLAQAYVYDERRDYVEKDIFGNEPNEAQTSFHKLNRKNYYKVTVNQPVLQRAFSADGGLSAFVQQLMAQPSTSDNWDEYLLMTSLFREYYERGGFFKIKVADLANSTTTATDAQDFLLKARTVAEKLPFLDRKYNAAKLPVSCRPEDLELFITPEASAKIDVQALAGAFNIDKAAFASRQTIIREEDMRIPGVQAILTTKDFFVVADTLMESRSVENPIGLNSNYFLHHHQIMSASRFVPAILFNKDEDTTFSIVVSPVSGPATLTLTDPANAYASTTTPVRGKVYVLSQGSVATTTPGAGLNNGITASIQGATSPRTYITQTGVLVIGVDEASTLITITARATDDPSYKATLQVVPSGDLLQLWGPGQGGPNVDTNVATLTNGTKPRIQNTNRAATGTVLTVDPGQYDQEPDSYTTQWFRAGTAIAGATASTYTLVSADIGQAVTVQSTAVKSGFTSITTASSNSVTITA